jgi:excinuclease ABC subunit A
MEVDPELLVPDPSKSLDEGAIQPWSGANVSQYFERLLGALAKDLKIKTSTPFGELPAKAKKSLLTGHEKQVHVSYKNRYGRERSYYTTFEGVIPYVERRHAEAASDTSRERFEGYMREVPCLACNGARLKPISLAVTLGGKNIAEISAMSIDEVHGFLSQLDLTPRERQIAERVTKEIGERLRFLLDVGLDYLALNRPAGSLSGGGTADPAGDADRIRPGGRAVCTRRAVDRTAPAGQPPPDRHAGPTEGPG